MSTPSAPSFDGGVSTREHLLSQLDDLELCSHELLENLIATKSNRMSSADHSALTDLMLEKEKQFSQTLKVASYQGEVEDKIVAVQQELAAQDECVQQMQKKFKEAETLLSTTIYHARQKLTSISKAQSLPVNAEELIQYGHRISASNAVSAPLNWEQGDPRRPYPTDIEMRLGFLGRPETANERTPAHLRALQPPLPHTSGAGSAASAHNTPGGAAAAADFHPSSSPFGAAAGAAPSPNKQLHGAGAAAGGGGGGGQFAWQAGEMGMTMKDGSHVPIPGAGAGGGGNQDEVEVMSTDSSSSSSTDSN